MDNIIVSIIIPVYNTERYLKQCLDSVVNQILKEIEIICVDDGSTDGSLQILEAYAKKDERIKIINKENRGQGAARNTGMKLANGKYIGFVDSDDWIELHTYEELYNNAVSNNSDIVLFETKIYNEGEYDYYGGYDIKDGNIDFNHFTFNFKDKKPSPPIKPVLVNRTVSACLKLYKTEFLRQYDNIIFPENTYFEDVTFHMLTLLKADKISYCNDRLYIYRKSNDHSTCSISLRSKKLWDIFPVMEEAKKVLIENNVMDVFRYEFITFTILQFSRRLDTCSDSIKNRFLEDIKKYFGKLGWSTEEIDKLHPAVQIIYKSIMNSNYYNEFELRRKNLQLDDIKSYQEKIIQQKDEQINTLENNLKTHQEKITTLKSDNTKLNELNTNYKEKLNQLDGIKSYQEKIIQQKDEQINTYISKINTLKNNLKTHQEQVCHLENKQISNISEIKSLNSNLIKEKKENENLTNQINQLNELIKAYRSRKVVRVVDFTRKAIFPKK